MHRVCSSKAHVLRLIPKLGTGYLEVVEPQKKPSGLWAPLEAAVRPVLFPSFALVSWPWGESFYSCSHSLQDVPASPQAQSNGSQLPTTETYKTMNQNNHFLPIKQSPQESIEVTQSCHKRTVRTPVNIWFFFLGSWATAPQAFGPLQSRKIGFGMQIG